MIRIERLKLRLPFHMAPHARDIAQRLGESLAATPVDRAGRIERCNIPAISVDPQLGPTTVADIASQAILRHLKRYRP